MRTQRIESLIKQEVSKILLRELSDPRIGFATITRVEVSKDIKFAKIYYSVLGSEEEKKKTQLGLKSATGFIKKIIGEKLKLRFTPEIVFKPDEALSKSLEVNRLLDELEQKG